MSPEEFSKFGFIKDSKTGMYKKREAEVPKGTVSGKPASRNLSFKGHIFIPGNVPSSKNSKQIFQKKINEKQIPFITDSKLTKAYKKDTVSHWLKYKSYFHELIKDMEPPYIIEFTFIRSSKRKFDFNNANHVCTDLMATHGWVEDDHMDLILPIPKLIAPHYYVSPKNPGVWITVKKPI